MNQESIPLYPNLKKTLNICKFTYQILELKLKESVRVAVYLFNETDLLVDSKQFLIESHEYEKWGQDDNYILTLLKQKIQSSLQ
jgi:hypothetical protein